MTITVTDRDLTHYVEETLSEPGYDVPAIVDALRPYVEFGDVDTSWYVDDEDDGWFWSESVDRTAELIGRMLKANGVDEARYWKIVAAHDTAGIWWTTVGFGGNPAPGGPWHEPEARDVLERWCHDRGAWAGTLVAAHTVRVYGYKTRAQARAADISDTPGRDGCVSVRGFYEFLGGAR